MSQVSSRVLDIVRSNSGRYTREEIVTQFDESERGNVRKSLSQNVNAGNFFEQGGRIHHGSAPTSGHQGETTHQYHDNATYSAEEFYEVPPFLQGQTTEVVFRTEVVLTEVVRIGFSNDMSKLNVQWFPTPAGFRLNVLLGNFPLENNMEVQNAKYLVVVQMEKGRAKIRYHLPPNGQKFVLQWVPVKS